MGGSFEFWAIDNEFGVASQNEKLGRFHIFSAEIVAIYLSAALNRDHQKVSQPKRNGPLLRQPWMFIREW